MPGVVLCVKVVLIITENGGGFNAYLSVLDEECVKGAQAKNEPVQHGLVWPKKYSVR